MQGYKMKLFESTRTFSIQKRKINEWLQIKLFVLPSWQTSNRHFIASDKEVVAWLLNDPWQCN